MGHRGSSFFLRLIQWIIGDGFDFMPLGRLPGHSDCLQDNQATKKARSKSNGAQLSVVTQTDAPAP